VAALAVGLLAPTAFATNYTWSGGGGNNNWTNPSNWGGGGYPQSSSDAALFNSDATVTLDSGNTLTVGYISVGADKTVTLNGTEGSALNPYKTAAGDGNGFVIAAGGKLILNVPVVSTGRIDKWGQGELVANANITVTGTDSDGYYFFVDCGTMTLQGSAVLSVPVGYLTLGNSTSRLPMSLVIKDSARVSAYGIRATIATNPNTDAGHIVQDGVDTEVSAYRVVLSGVAGRPEAMGIYELKAGTFTVGEGNIALGMTGVGSNNAPYAGGRFVQSGGHAVVSNKFSVVYDTDGSGIYLSGGTLTFVTSYYTASSAMIGAPLNLSDSPTIDVQGPQLTFPVATTFAPDTVLTKTGLYNSNLIVNNDLAMDGSLVVKSGYFLAGYSYEVKDVELSAPDDDHSAWPVTLDGGIFNVSLVRSRVTRPLALTIENGGKVRFPAVNDANNPIYARSILVAHSLVVDGVTMDKGRYTTDNLPGIFASGSAGNASVVVPYVWTGAGNGTSWDDAANWDGGDVPPSGATTAVDLSRAGGKTIMVNDNKTVTCIIFNPQGREKKLTISGSGKIVHSCPSFTVGMFVGPGRELVFDVDVDKASYDTGLGYNIPTIVGGGRIIVKRNFPGILSTDSYKRAGYAIDGELAFAGTTTFLTSDGYKLFGVGTWEPQGKSKIVFEDGCNLTAWRLDPSPIGNLVASDEWVQNGGSVSLANFYFTRYYSNARSPFSYTLNGGSLSVSSELTLGSYYYTVATRYSGGEFVMNGGTLTANEIRCQRYNNYIRLNGGDVYLKAGFKDTFATAPQVQTVTNEWSVKIGGAKIHATGTWANGLSTEFTGLNGAATIDTAGYNVTFSKSVQGVGGFVKDGNGILTFSDSATFTGPVIVNGGSVVFGSTVNGPKDFTVSSGTLSFQAAPTAELDSIVVPSASDIVVSASASGLSVKRLVIGGNVQPVGSISVNGGSVNVTGSSESVWVGTEGGNWSTAGNWTAGVPNSTAAAVDFGYSALASDATINVDAAITIKNLTYRHATDGASLTLAGSSTLSFAAGGVIDVPAGNTLVINANATLLGTTTKKGQGTLVLNGVLAGNTAAGGFYLATAEGEVVLNGEQKQCRIWTSSELQRPRLTIGPNAVATNACSVNASWGSGTSGEIVQNGGLVDLNPPEYGFFSANPSCWYLALGNGKYTLNGGTLALYRTNSSFGFTDDSMVEFVQNGGLLKVGEFCKSGVTTGNYTYTLNGGTNEIGNSWIMPVTGRATAYLNGGAIVSGGNAAMFSHRIDVVMGGDVTFAQKNADVAVTLGSDMSGTGTIRQAGPGKLTLAGDSYWFLGALAVDGGTLGISNPVRPETTLDIASGAAVSIDCDEVVIKRLAVNGVERGAGRYSAASGKDIGGRIQGTGVLVVQEGIGPGSIIVVF